MRKLDFNFVEEMREDLLKLSTMGVVFIKPFGAKLFRVYNAPSLHKDGVSYHDNELIQVLNTICTHYHSGVWYFREEIMQEVGDILVEMGTENLLVQPDTVGLN